MSDDTDGGGWLSDAVDGGRTVAETITTVFGTQRERHVCSDCNTPCEQTRVHDPKRAAFDGGVSPAWTCPDCGTDYRRDADDRERHTGDLYDR